MLCRALRVVNPSPYMVYLQARGSILVASSPEILCRVGHDRKVINRFVCLLGNKTTTVCLLLGCKHHSMPEINCTCFPL